MCMSHVKLIPETWHTYEWVMTYVRKSRVTKMNESCHTYNWVMSQVRMSYVKTQLSHVIQIMSHVRLSHVARANELRQDTTESCHPNRFVESHKSCNTYEWVTSHAWMSHITRTCSRLTCLNDLCHVSQMTVTCHAILYTYMHCNTQQTKTM